MIKLNKTISAWAITIFLLQVSPPGIAASPAWCNADTLNTTEQIICDDPTLSQADALLEQLYRAILSFRGLEGHEGMWPGEIISNQRDWIVERNNLRDRTEILDAYSARIQSLTSVLKLRWQPL